MPTLNLTKNYADGTILFASDFSAFITDMETFFNITKITDGNIQNASLTGSTVLTDSSVTTAKIIDSNVTTAKIADLAVTTGVINDSAVTTVKIADSNVTTTELADSAVETSNIADASITRAKILSNYVMTAASTDNIYSASATAFNNLSTSFTVVQNPVEIRIISSYPGVGGGAFLWGATNTGYYPIFELYRDAVVVGSWAFRNWNNIVAGQADAVQGEHGIPSLGPVIDDPGTGTYTYTLKARWSIAPGYPIQCFSARMFVREL